MSVASERFEQPACLAVASCAEQETWQRDHAIASPIGEPGIAGDDSLIVRREMDPGGFLRSWLWSRHDKLIGCDNQTRIHRIAFGQVGCRAVGDVEQLLDAALVAA